LIRNARRLGAAASKNVGARAARGRYLWFLDSDTQVPLDTFELAGRLVKGRPLPIGLVAGVIAWGAEGFGLYLVLDAMGAGIDPAPAIAVYSIAVLAGALAFLPGGLGSTEAMMILLLSALGADSATAVAATLVCRIVTLWFAVGLGAIAVGVLAARGFLPRLNAEETS